MPHLVLLYTPPLEKRADFDVLCRDLANCMLAQRDEQLLGLLRRQHRRGFVQDEHLGVQQTPPVAPVTITGPLLGLRPLCSSWTMPNAAV